MRLPAVWAMACAVVVQALHATPALAMNSWLDRPIRAWNKAGAAVPKPPRLRFPIDKDSFGWRYLQLIGKPLSRTERELVRAGWYIQFRRQLGPFQILVAAATVDGMGRPEQYHHLVYFGGKFVGTLSPRPMSSRTDGAAYTETFDGKLLHVSYDRYHPMDALCCPSHVSRLAFVLDRSDRHHPVLVPVSSDGSQRPPFMVPREQVEL